MRVSGSVRTIMPMVLIPKDHDWRVLSISSYSAAQNFKRSCFTDKAFPYFVDLG